MVDLSEVQQRILESVRVLGGESVHILDSLRRVLAQDVLVTEDFPPSDISAMDGYAVSHGSLRGISPESPVQLRIIGESPAGRPYGGVVGDGEAVRIMTGGMVPSGADTVVRIEDTSEDGGYVICKRRPDLGDGIRFRGDSLKQGEVVLRAGDVISPVEVGVLATLRRACVYVHQKPVVAVLATGDELTDFHDPPSPWKAMCSNLYALTAQVTDTGAVPLCLGIVGDDLQKQRAMFGEALRADVIITSGGLSKGKYDLVQKAFASLGMDMKFTSIFAKPGKPTIFGMIGPKVIFGLPGNPSATMLSFEQFIKPALLKMMGHTNLFVSNPCRSHWRDVNGPISHIDSFSEGNLGKSGQFRASLVALGKPSPINGKNCPHESSTPNMGLPCTGRFTH